jgi:hypothetical protein
MAMPSIVTRLKAGHIPVGFYILGQYTASKAIRSNTYYLPRRNRATWFKDQYARPVGRLIMMIFSGAAKLLRLYIDPHRSDAIALRLPIDSYFIPQ